MARSPFTTSDDPRIRAEDEAQGERYGTARLEVADARPPEFSDEALALRFSEKHGDAIQYVAAWNRWLHWTGQHWETDA
jgi:hypothetical protein